MAASPNRPSPYARTVASSRSGARARTRNSQVVGRFFNPGGSPQGVEFTASTINAVNGRPDVALKPNGDAYVVWERGADDTNEPATVTATPLGAFARQHRSRAAGTSDVVGRFFNPNGQAMSGEQTVSNGTDSAGSPSVSTSGDGDIVVAMEQEGSNGDSSVAVTEVAPSGSPSGLMTISQTGSTASQPQVEHTNNGGTVVIFQQQQAVGGTTKDSKRSSNIVGRTFNPNMQATGGTFSVSGMTEEFKKSPEVSTNSKGDCFVVWQAEGGTGSKVEGQALDGCSQPTGSAMTLNTTGQRSPGNPATALDDDGSVTAVFTEDDVAGRVPERLPAFAWAREAVAATQDPCVADDETLCLGNERFSVRANWRDFQGGSGVAKVEKLTNDTGYFWFFDPANVEILLKTLDACSFANRFWVFAGGLTSVEVDIVVTDTQTGQTKNYSNPLGTPLPTGPGHGRIQHLHQPSRTRLGGHRDCISGEAPLGKSLGRFRLVRRDALRCHLQPRRSHVVPEPRPLSSPGTVGRLQRRLGARPGDSLLQPTHRLLLVLCCRQCRSRHQGPRCVRSQQLLLGLCRRPDQRGGRTAGDRYPGRHNQDLQQHPGRAFRTHPGHVCVRHLPLAGQVLPLEDLKDLRVIPAAILPMRLHQEETEERRAGTIWRGASRAFPSSNAVGRTTSNDPGSLSSPSHD